MSLLLPYLCEEMLRLLEPLKSVYDEVDVSVMEQAIFQSERNFDMECVIKSQYSSQHFP